ncbi:MAG TPA: aminotransferase class I/II-fold pyridoxal phosphate-dependent enzyme [Thauera sp.]|uniref:aminotransferase class I/II-fold pyridoxal phosphate-dependent enzyme n=1 Tax=Thauera sp. WB-2 TaxID=2897772 RepID=UPI0022DD4F88|nr:aminotransferase class I/II-fold pyridoxal phosphate-dependent enzyme [Thauera sp. WB-2]WBL65840.1 aminotransferase class I/II-fold pyridoxal phosphate-dependent enzyme [Thauera sp. WB-2]HRJ23408.1 aminotransferase class I/II-fold pyridoxal phosphate-dependent enzyme [Thauera sp.]
MKVTRKRSVDELALFGGPALFQRPRSIGQLDAPPIEPFLASLKSIIEQRRLTNDGPFVRELEAQLAAYHGVAHVVALANAGLGLMMLMQTFSDGRPGTVIMPAFSFRGLPHFARWAGQTPCFADVTPDTHTLQPESVENCITDRTRSILAVCNVNGAGNIDDLTSVAARHGIPLFFDSVYGIGNRYGQTRLGGFGRAEVFSLHATKLLNGFEGGYVTTNDAGLAQSLRHQRNFAYGSDTAGLPPHLLGCNAKLNEIHAAMALHSLQNINAIIDANRRRFALYRKALSTLPGLSLLAPTGPDAETWNHSMVIAEIAPEWPLSRDFTCALLRAEGVAINPYYSPPLHLKDNDPVRLPVTESLAQRFLQLPAGHQVRPDDIAAIGELLQFLHAHGDSIAARRPASSELCGVSR